VTLTIDDGRASGTSACNQYSGTVDVTATSIRFSDLGGTEMGCDEPIMDFERAYPAALPRTTAAAKVGRQLVLSGSGVELRFDPAMAPEDKPLVGTVWELQTLLNGSTASSTVRSLTRRSATLEFTAKGEMSGSTGCNSFGGSYELTNQTVTPGSLLTTQIGCPTGLAEQEAHVMAVLSGSFTVAIEGDQLTVTGGDERGLTYVAAKPSTSSGEPTET
jgi:heat shock protein HslJ